MKTKSSISCIAITICIASLSANAQAPLAWSTNNFLDTYPQYQSGNQYPQKIETSSDGSVFAAGTFFFVNYQRKLCVIKYNNAGDSTTSFVDDNLTATPSLNNYVNDMLIDGSNNIYVLGTTSDSVHINGLNYKGATRLYKLNSSLSLLWSADITDADMNSMIFDASGNIALCGTTKNNGDGTGRNIFTEKYDNQGNQLWNVTYASTGSYDDLAADIASDGSGNVYVTGNSNVAANGKTIHTLKYNSAGQLQWDQSYNTFTTAGTIDQAQSIAVSPSGNSYVSGMVTTGPYNVALRFVLIKYDANGTEQWRKPPVSTSGNRSYIPVKVRLDIYEHVYLVTVHSNFASSVYSNYNKQVQIRRYSSNGSLNWNLTRDTSNANDFDVTPLGTIYISGSNGTLPKFDALKISTSGSILWEDKFQASIFPDQTGSLGYGTCVGINPLNPFAASFGAFEQVVQPNYIYSNQWTVRKYNSFALKSASLTDENFIGNVSVNIFPNPASDFLYIKSNNDLNDAFITISNVIGQAVKTFIVTNAENKIIVAGLKPGIYFIDIAKGDYNVTEKFLKQ